MLLSSYEVVEASEASHRSHYQGALELSRAREISVISTGLDRANFTVYVRHEITIALANESPLQLELEHWNVTKPEAGAPEDQIAMYSMWLAGTAVNLVHGGESNIERQQLIVNVESWYKDISETFRGIDYGGMNDEGLKKVFFAVPAAGESCSWISQTTEATHLLTKQFGIIAAAMLWYHLIYILLFAEHQATNQTLVGLSLSRHCSSA